MIKKYKLQFYIFFCYHYTKQINRDLVLNKMRFFILIILLSIQLISSPVKFTKEEKAWIEKNPLVTYVGDPDWLPFEAFDKNGNYVGIVADLLKYIEKTTSLKFKIIKTDSWSESVKIMADGKAMIISQSQDANAKTSLLFTTNYYKNPIVIIMDKKQYIPSLEKIKNKKISIIKREPFFKKIKEEYPDINFINVKSVTEGLQSLNDGKADAFVNTLARTSYYMAKLQLNNLKMVGRTKFYVELGFGIAPKNHILKQIINKALSNIPKDVGNKILSKWITQQYVEKPDYTSLYIAIAVFMVIFGMGLTFYIRLKKETNARIDAQNKMLKQQSKMASMGEMLDSVAHQWKQPLNAITMYLELLKSDFEDGLVDKAYIDEMQEGTQNQIEHMMTTLQEFRNFFRPNHAIEDFNLLKLTNSVLLLTKDEFLKNQINIVVQINENITLHGNQNEFKHLIINIINNAKDAFNEKEITNRQINIKATQDAKNVLITIEDNAGGIPPDALEHIFEANFTTKAKDKGTGIGLYMSTKIIEKMSGTIKAENINEGACFYITVKRI